MSVVYTPLKKNLTLRHCLQNVRYNTDKCFDVQ